MGIASFDWLPGQDKKLILEKKSVSQVTYMFMTLATSLVVLFNCYATADILTKFLQQCFLFFIVVVIPEQ